MDLRGIRPYSTSHSTKLSTVSAVMAARTVSTALFLSPRVSRMQVSLDLNILSVAQRTPAERMKTNREHRVPLSTGALAVLREARSVVDGSDLVLPSVRGRALSDATISKMVRELGTPAVPHGFRLSFRGIELPGLGGGVLRHAARGVRTRSGAREPGPGRGCLPPDGPLRAPKRTHGRLGRVSGAVLTLAPGSSMGTASRTVACHPGRRRRAHPAGTTDTRPNDAPPAGSPQRCPTTHKRRAPASHRRGYASYRPVL